MIAALVLTAFSGLLVVAAPRVLVGRSWTRRSPRLGVIAWLVATVALPVSLVLGGAALALPASLTASDDLAGLLGSCGSLLRQHYETPGSSVVHLVHLVGTGFAVAVAVRVAWVAASHLRVVRAERRRQRARIALAGRAAPEPGVRMLDDARPAIFCIPGRRPAIVMTTGAAALLTSTQRDLALAHERAHLAGRHHLALTAVAVLRTALPRIGLFAVAEAEVAVLVEMHADDRATRGRDRRELAVALVALASGAQPDGALAVNGGGAVQRVRRLLMATPSLSLAQRGSVAASSVAALAAPLLIALAPAAEATWRHCCGYVVHG